jgi:hypothetical protein
MIAMGAKEHDTDIAATRSHFAVMQRGSANARIIGKIFRSPDIARTGGTRAAVTGFGTPRLAELRGRSRAFPILLGLHRLARRCDGQRKEREKRQHEWNGNSGHHGLPIRRASMAAHRV